MSLVCPRCGYKQMTKVHPQLHFLTFMNPDEPATVHIEQEGDLTVDLECPACGSNIDSASDLVNELEYLKKNRKETQLKKIPIVVTIDSIPSCCNECKFAQGDWNSFDCLILEKEIDIPNGKNRLEDCPFNNTEVKNEL